jgi:uncharacterized repeat protein (TIGR01451 family)/LPXTG-motif cell wall-anchored protein
VAPPDSGDDVNPGVLDPGETWTWVVTTNPTADVTVTATGHGTDPIGNDITYPFDLDERDQFSVDVIAPSTDVGITAEPVTGLAGTEVLWTVTETNDGDVDLTGVFVNLDASTDDDDDGDVAVLDENSAGFSGDDGDGILNPGETWTWTLTTTVDADITVIATGHGLDPIGNDITYPDYPSERDEAAVDIIAPSTDVSITADVDTILSGDPVTWTVTETNDGDVDLTGVFVNLDASTDDDDDGDVAVLDEDSDGFSGDDGDGILNPGETWTWVVVTNPADDVTVIATGHGLDPIGNDITYPFDLDERDTASIDVIFPTTVVEITVDLPAPIAPAEATWTIKETNDGDVDLTDVFVNLDASTDDDDDGDVAVLDKDSAGFSGDDGDGILNPGETWTWVVTNTLTDDLTVVATGHGLDPLGNDITYPADPDERDEATADVEQPAALGDYVWEDLDEDGIQDPEEFPVAGVVVNLYGADNMWLASTTTDEDGLYLFDGLAAGEYRVEFELPGGYVGFTQRNQGDGTNDSDADPDGSTDPVTLAEGEINLTIDAGVVLEVAANPDVAITKTDGGVTIVLSEDEPVGEIAYVVTVENVSEIPATGTVMTDTLPDTVTFKSAVPDKGTCSLSGQVLTCDIGDLAPGETVDIAIVVTTESYGQLTETNVVNTACVEVNEEELVSDNNCAEETTPISEEELPETGFESGPLALMGTALLGLGALLLATTRRRDEGEIA